MDNRILILPDIHGRSFWKEAVEAEPDARVVFLGDYLDPYEEEGISQSRALHNFMEILALKRQHPERVTLLLGNHDIHYLDPGLCSSRKDLENEMEIRKLYRDNWQLFRLAEFRRIGERGYLFSHAGLLRVWMEIRLPVQIHDDVPAIVSYLNGTLQDGARFKAFLREGLTDVSFERCGSLPFGSIVWADVNDHVMEDDPLPGVYQIFGHTQLRNGPHVTETFADLDCRQPFLLTAGGLYSMQGNPEPDNNKQTDK